MKSANQVNSRDSEKVANPMVFQLGYEPSLDGLRGIAILVVMAFNGKLLWMRGGFIGVDIFFVLSGFLITALLVQGYQKTGSMGFKNFYFRRALRLLPALFLLMLFCIAYALFFQPADKAAVTLNGVLYTLFYVANWVQVPPYLTSIGVLSHAWSLSVEEQFYIVWPLLLLLLLKLKSKGFVIGILLCLIGISVLLNVWFWNAGVPYIRMYMGSDTRANELLIGCLAALLLLWGILRPTDRLKWAFHAASLISIAGILLSFFLLSFKGGFVYNGGFALISIGTAVLILDFLLFPSRLSRLFEFAPLVWLGKISYGLYLWHFPIFEGSKKFFEGRMNPEVYQVIGVVAALLAAAASYYLIEQPFLRLRRHFKTNEPMGPMMPVSTQSA
ncbi:MAG: acyltransferase family protein [Pyrinomonadaceae bacterium]